MPGTSCYVGGSQEIFQAFKEELGLDDDDTTPDGLFTLRSTRCMGPAAWRRWWPSTTTSTARSRPAIWPLSRYRVKGWPMITSTNDLQSTREQYRPLIEALIFLCQLTTCRFPWPPGAGYSPPVSSPA
ncbi:NAD(P)H-dependent oxidoreductase subunit E [Neomoorella thermoacetica]|uniref:NAD(P)H-dependent oxidoreductase subunit E n=1 Tax=Neomoorella thermoacetica TaxID=1525 RepID=UPI0009C01765